MALDILITQALGGVTVVAESNVAPPVTLYDANDASPSVLDALGVKTRLVIRRNGEEVVAYGDPVRPNLLLAGFLLAVALAGVIVLGAAVGRFVK